MEQDENVGEGKTIDEEMDLPLMANVDTMRVMHYMFHLRFDFTTQIVDGEAILFCRLTNNESSENDYSKPFELVLDQRHLSFHTVEEILSCEEEIEKVSSGFESRRDLGFMQECFKSPTSRLNFKEDPWCLRISKDAIYNPRDFPKILKIKWSTQNQAKSLMWRKDQSGNPSVFTAAAAVNNRSLFPCQEPPIAMATWQCLLESSDQQMCILCTGDQDASLLPNGQRYFYTQMVLPMSTFAVAIGKWSCLDLVEKKKGDFDKVSKKNEPLNPCQKLHDPYPCHVSRGDSGPLIPCRLFGPDQMLETATELWLDYMPVCLESAYELLGPHPFQKLDIVVVPRCYSGLGLASPNLMFVSQTLVLATDGGMMIRLSHEVSHNWFGLLIGALDWTEEWLTEGFATFAEDFIHNRAMQKLSAKKAAFGAYPLENEGRVWQDLADLRRLIRYQTLRNELDCTPIDHQIIRPMRGQELKDAETNISYVKNGQNPQMAYTQVHYLKGSFLLAHLCHAVGGEDTFFAFLRYYAQDLYHGRLVHSTDFLRLFFQRFEDVEPFQGRSVEENISRICAEWLDTAEVPLSVKSKCEGIDNDLLKAVMEAQRECLRPMKRKRASSGRNCNFDHLLPEQLILLLEAVVSECNEADGTKKQQHRCQRRLKEEVVVNFRRMNADVQHRCCELIICCGWSDMFPFLHEFLTQHQAMGVYLYGEMMLNDVRKKKSLSHMARSIFREIEDELDYSTRENVHNILHGG